MADDDKTLVAATGTDNPMTILARAIDQKMDPAIIEKMMDLRDRWEATEARKAFNEAVAAFKLNPPRVFKDQVNKQYNSRYTSKANLVNTVNKTLSLHGLNARWELKQADGMLTVRCVLAHVMGHSEFSELSGPPDESGSKNKLQQIKSTKTYLEIATFEAVTGVASEQGALDDDGNASEGAYITTDQVTVLQDAINELSDTDAGRKSWMTRFLKWAGVESLTDIRASKFENCRRELENRKGQAK